MFRWSMPATLRVSLVNPVVRNPHTQVRALKARERPTPKTEKANSTTTLGSRTSTTTTTSTRVGQNPLSPRTKPRVKKDPNPKAKVRGGRRD